MAAIVHRYKFGGDLCVGAVLSFLLAATVSTLPLPQCIVAVPSSTRRRRLHGFDPGLEIARGVASTLGVRLEPRAARRTADHPPQSSLPDWRLRRANVRDAFHVEPARVMGRTVALVDDVMTSGATAGAVAEALRASGALQTEVWVACRAGLAENAG